MDNSTSQTELVMRYLDGEMTASEKTEFETRLSLDERLRQELEDLQTSREAVKLFGLKQKVSSVHRKLMEEVRPEAVVRKLSARRRIIRYGLGAAATIIFIAVCVLAYDFFGLSADKLYKEKFSSFELSTLRGSDGSRVTQIEMAYRERNYAKVIQLSTISATLKDQLLIGVSFLEVDKPNEAVGYFIRVINAGKSIDQPSYKDDAEYYLALSYLKTKNYDEAVALMHAIHENPSHVYHEKFTNGFIRRVRMLKLR